MTSCVLSHMFFLLTIRLLHISTLFPYTTLFRSIFRKCGFRFGRKTRIAPELDYLLDPIDAIEDRKSTRLNSSHVSKSYAVLFLKKKKLGSAGCRATLVAARAFVVRIPSAGGSHG